MKDRIEEAIDQLVEDPASDRLILSNEEWKARFRALKQDFESIGIYASNWRDRIKGGWRRKVVFGGPPSFEFNAILNKHYPELFRKEKNSLEPTSFPYQVVWYEYERRTYESSRKIDP